MFVLIYGDSWFKLLRPHHCRDLLNLVYEVSKLLDAGQIVHLVIVDNRVEGQGCLSLSLLVTSDGSVLD